MDDVLKLGVALIVFCSVAVVCIVGKGCNDSDNQVWMKSLEKGCSHPREGGIICPGYKGLSVP